MFARNQGKSASTRGIGLLVLGLLLVPGPTFSASPGSTVESLPPASLPASDPPIYFEPQGVFSLGTPESLARVRQIRLRHNLASGSDLRILLDARNSHSLVANLKAAGFGVSQKKPSSEKIAAGNAEIYFHEFSRARVGGPLPDSLRPFERMGDEGYVLVAETAGPDSFRIVVAANSPKGLFRGGMTVERLLVDQPAGRRRSRLEPVVVLDYPDHPFRGAQPSWAPMNANSRTVPEKTLDMLDSLARAGANSVNWMASWSAQEKVGWEKNGAWSAALVQVAAAERFMGVSYFMGSSAVSYGVTGPPKVARTQSSLAQVPYGDGLGVFEEPFSWVETEPGRWQARSERQGTLHGRGTDAVGSPWTTKACSPGAWRYESSPGSAPGKAKAWHLGGRARDCELSQSLDVKDGFSPGRYFLAGRLRVSPDAAGVAGSVALEIEADGQPQRFLIPLDAANLSGDRWSELALVIPDLGVSGRVSAARLVVRASLSAGSLWLDDITLHEWSRDTFSSANFKKSAGWILSDSGSGLAVDNSRGHGDTTSLRAELPISLEPGQGALLAQTFQSIRLEEGRYVLGVWLKAARSEPNAQDEESDQDGDGLADDVETGTWLFRGADNTGTDPAEADSDADGFDDGVEVIAGSDPTNKRSKPGKNFSIKADVNLQLFDRPVSRRGRKGQQVVSEYLSLPQNFKLDPGDWFYHAHVFDVSAELAERIQSARVQVRIFQAANQGSVWIDDIHIRRLDGELRNLMGAVAAPVLKDPSGSVYVEGRDYVVCQVGSEDTLCSPPLNYTTTLKGGLASTYNPEQPPFEIRWRGEEPPANKRLLVSYDIGAQYSSVGSARIDWDDKIRMPTALNFCDIGAVARGIQQEAIIGRYLDGYTVKNFPAPGRNYLFKADTVTWGVSEVRGINRSTACLGKDGEILRSNAALFADVVNNIASIVKRKNPDARFWLWADMFNPFDIGGDDRYQVKYGGAPGSSACAFAPGAIPSLCGDEIENVVSPIVDLNKTGAEGVIMQPWFYWPYFLRQMVASAAWYQGLGVRVQVLPGANPVNIEDWAGIAKTFDAVEGVVGTIYHANFYQGKSGLLPALRKFWNHDWRLLYLRDNETTSSSHYQVPWSFSPELELSEARHDVSGACAVSTSRFSGNNDGGICLASAPARPVVGLSGVPVRGGARYRLDVMVRPRGGSPRSRSQHPPKISVAWSSGESIGPFAAELIYDYSIPAKSNRFNRYRVEVEAPSEAVAMDLKISFGRDGESMAVDDIAIFESTEPCFNNCEMAGPVRSSAKRSKGSGAEE